MSLKTSMLSHIFVSGIAFSKGLREKGAPNLGSNYANYLKSLESVG
jgi:hypothetical protein